jgi:hypothetical protein
MTAYEHEPHVASLINDHTRIICTATAILFECVDCGVITEMQELRHDTECTGNAPDVGGDAGIMHISDFQPFDLPPLD